MVGWGEGVRDGHITDVWCSADRRKGAHRERI